MVGRKKQPISDQAEDLECLCHLMKTCGRILDTPKGKLRMDQYIERLEGYIENPQMPLRIRFMLQVSTIMIIVKYYIRMLKCLQPCWQYCRTTNNSLLFYIGRN